MSQTAHSYSGRVLWVDDEPQNNLRERKALEGFGYQVTTVLSTRQALERLAAVIPFDVVLSDMGRQEGSREGYVLLDEMRRRGLKTPVFFYAGSKDPKHVAETALHGGQGCTNEMRELIEMVRGVAAVAS